jgi:hypothetical protein
VKAKSEGFAMNSRVSSKQEVAALPYPKRFFQQCPIEKEQRRVFVIMPFRAPHSVELYESIELVCRRYAFVACRADQTTRVGIVKADILEHLAKADIVIADLTGGNANVFYELGLAHMLFDCNHVISLVQQNDERRVPFDVQDIRYLKFDVDNPGMRNRFEAQLGEILADLRIAPPGIITSALDRTKTLVSDLQELARLAPEELRREAVYFSGGLSAFAISAKEKWLTLPGDEKVSYHEYQEWLMKEKNALVDIAQKGCPVYCIITPPAEPYKAERLLHLNARKRTLLNFLRGNDEMLHRNPNALGFMKFALSPYRQKNLYIIGHVSYVEGYKDLVHRGFSLSLRQTSRAAIDANIDLYTALFPRMAEYTIEKYGEGKGLCNYTAEDLRDATMKFLEEYL